MTTTNLHRHGTRRAAATKLVLADERTGTFDTAIREGAMQPLAELNVEGMTVVTVTRSRAHAEYANRIVNLFDGTVASESIRKALRG